MPFADSVGTVAIGLKDLGDGGGGGSHTAAGVWIAQVGAGQFLHAYGVAVAAGEESGARGRANGFGAEAVVE